MKIISCQSPIEAAEACLDLLQDMTLESAGLKIFLPTGRTPRDLYRLFAKEKKTWAPLLKPIQIDEFVDSQRLFFTELRTFLLTPLEIESQGSYIDPRWSDEEMVRHIAQVEKRGVDVALLGMGPNGHVGFHEPGLAEDFKGGRVMISEETKNRVPGATTNEALTFGVGTFLKAKHILLLITGEGKAGIYKKFLNSDPTKSLPASLLKQHPSLQVVTDLD